MWTIAAALLELWALGLATSYTMRGFIHLLPLAAIVVVVFSSMQGRRLA
jgi:hypothetical protein